jgi:phage terminase large subunit
MQIAVPEAMLPLWTMGKYEHFALFGGRGGAKSHGTAEAIVAHACQRCERVVCGRQFQASIKDSVKELLEKKIKSMGMAAFWSSTERELVNVSNGSRFSFVGMDRNPESAKSLEGATIFWGEEAQNFTALSIELIIPTIRTQGSRMYWTWNPRYKTDPVDALFRSPHPPEKSYVKMVNYTDNPWFYQTRMPSELRRMKLSNPKRALHVWDGGYDENPDAAIFTSYEIGRPDYIPEKEWPRFGLDFGYAKDPSALIKAYLLEDQATIYIAAEAYGHQVASRHLPDLIRSVSEAGVFPIVADSSRPETIEALCNAGLNVIPSRKGAGSVKNGINWLQGYKLLIDPDCQNFADEVKKYKWKQDRKGTILPVPESNQADHGIDALRYAFEDDSIMSQTEDGGLAYV